MKRKGFLYQDICSETNISKSLLDSAKGKRKKRAVQMVFKNNAEALAYVKSLLEEKSYIPSKYIEAKIYDGLSNKERTIFKPRYYPDQIIHWCLINVIRPLIMRGMYKWSCASIPNRGGLYAKKVCEKWIQTDPKSTRYCLKIDIRKFYPSIDKEILKQKFRAIIKDNDCLWLIDSIIDSHGPGIPIGNYTSQWFANFYLQGTDYFIKQKLGIDYYIRYMDDMVLFGPNKRELRKKFDELNEFVNQEHLQIKDNWQIFNVSKRPLDFCGFCFQRNKTFIRKRITKRMRRKSFSYSKKPSKHTASSLMSYFGWLKHSDSYPLFKRYMQPHFKQMKENIRNGN